MSMRNWSPSRNSKARRISLHGCAGSSETTADGARHQRETVEAHRENIKMKLNVAGAADLSAVVSAIALAAVEASAKAELAAAAKKWAGSASDRSVR